jgi:hypothetical protein
MRIIAAALAIFAASPAFAQDAVPPVLPDGVKEHPSAHQAIEQDLPPALASPDFKRDGIRIVFAQRYVDPPQPSKRLGQLDSGNVAIYAAKPNERLSACHDAVRAALDRLVIDAKKLGANAIVSVASFAPEGYLPAHPAYLCVETHATGGGTPGIVQRVRLVGTAAMLP